MSEETECNCNLYLGICVVGTYIATIICTLTYHDKYHDVIALLIGLSLCIPFDIIIPWEIASLISRYGKKSTYITTVLLTLTFLWVSVKVPLYFGIIYANDRDNHNALVLVILGSIVTGSICCIGVCLSLVSCNELTNNSTQVTTSIAPPIGRSNNTQVILDSGVRSTEYGSNRESHHIPSILFNMYTTIKEHVEMHRNVVR